MAFLYPRVFQPFSSRGTFETLLCVWQNLDTQNSGNLRIIREPCKDLVEPVGSAETQVEKQWYMQRPNITSIFR